MTNRDYDHDDIYQHLTDEQQQKYDFYMMLYGNVYIHRTKDGYTIINPLDVKIKDSDKYVVERD